MTERTGMRLTFRWRLFASFVALILATALLAGSLVTRRMTASTLAGIERRLETEAVLLGEIAAGTDPAVLQAKVEQLGHRLGTRFTVIRRDGLVLADSDEDPKTMDNHAQRPEVLQAAAMSRGVATRFSRTVHRRMMYVALPLPESSAGYARAALPLDTIDALVGEIRRLVFLAAGLAVAVALLLGFFVSRGLADPLRRLKRAAEEVAAGRYPANLELRSKDEVGDLADAFNAMSRRIESQIEQGNADREQLEAIFSSMVEGVVAVDANDRVVLCNRLARELLGIPSEGWQGRPLWELVTIADLPELVADTREGGGTTKRIVRRAGKTGDRYLELHGAPLRGGKGRQSGDAVLVVHDITQIRRLESMRQDFVANVSHELKTPLTVIRGFVETLLDEPDIDEETRQRFLDRVNEQTNRLSSLVGDLLSLSRLETEPAPELRSLDLGKLLQGAVDSLKSSAEARELGVEVHLPAEPVRARGEEETLHIAIVNLLDNAIKYSPKGATISATLRVGDGKALIEIADHGPGIPRHLQERIFERFYRVDKARSRELGGTGLGLAIAKHAMMVLGGEITVESTPGEGSTFRLALSIAPPEARPGEEGASSSEPQEPQPAEASSS